MSTVQGCGTAVRTSLTADHRKKNRFTNIGIIRSGGLDDWATVFYHLFVRKLVGHSHDISFLKA